MEGLNSDMQHPTVLRLFIGEFHVAGPGIEHRALVEFQLALVEE